MLSSVPSLGGIRLVEHFLNTENTRVSDVICNISALKLPKKRRNCRVKVAVRLILSPVAVTSRTERERTGKEGCEHNVN